jgi:hypothetical protein
VRLLRVPALADCESGIFSAGTAEPAIFAAS